MRLLNRRQTALAIAAGAGVLLFITVIVGAAALALVLTATGSSQSQSPFFDVYIWRVARFTLLQAAASTLLSVIPAIALARAIARRPQFPGRRLLILLLAVPLGLPPIVAALGIIQIWGRQGLLNELLLGLGLAKPVSIYGLPGILLAHVFFNLPLATRLLLARLEEIPSEYWRNAGQLGLSQRQTFLLIEWPQIRGQIPGVAGLVLMLCVTSFTLVLLLGGGPGATTIEVAIYQSLRFDFDPPRAVVLALIQLAMTGAMLAVLALVGKPQEEEPVYGRASRHYGRDSIGALLGDYGLIVIGGLFIVAPLLAVAAAGLASDLARLAGEDIVVRAAVTSLAIGALAATISVSMAAVLIHARRASLPLARHSTAATAFRSAVAAISSLILLAPPIVLGAGWFVLLRGHTDVFGLAPVIIVAVNALMALPFVMRVMEPAHASHMARTGRLSASLGLTGLRKFLLVDWPGLRTAFFLAAAFAMALSLGDLGAIALFGSQDVITLPYLLLQRMSSYRTEDAAGIALILGLVCLVLMIIANGGRKPSAGGF